MEKLETLKKNFKWIVFALCVVTVIGMLIGIIKYKVLPIDTWAIENIVKGARTDLATMFFKVITFFGEAKLLLPVAIIGSAIVFFFFKDKKRSTCFAGNLALIAGINWVIKHIIQRPRPDEALRLVTEDGYSFPSGHAMVTTAFYGLIIFFVCNNVQNKLAKNLICICLSLLIVLIDLSRVYLGVHYVSDVLSGTLISVAYLIVATTIAKKYVFNN